MAEYGGEIRIGYLYAVAGVGFLAFAAWQGIIIVMEEIQYRWDERTLRDLNELESGDRAAGDPPFA